MKLFLSLESEQSKNIHVRAAGMPAGFRVCGVMLSVVIEAQNGDEERLAHTLAFLVPAAVEGLVREVIVVGAPAASGVAAVVEHAGCGSATAVSDAVRTARGEWLLLLEAGARLREGWGEAVLRQAAKGAAPARFTPEGKGWARLGSLFWRGRSLAYGLLIARAEAAALVREGETGETLARRVRSRRLALPIVRPG